MNLERPDDDECGLQTLASISYHKRRDTLMDGLGPVPCRCFLGANLHYPFGRHEERRKPASTCREENFRYTNPT